ncbi:hypothetical protein Cob_v012259 [Colletotrichum orbiculare MAFF 240422]|uniref:DUF1214 domain-containing protein n=1 Tax=Colletotrichum orbiculare (strain 104-T / ATCC 96160 / CBS 514.97 / LARS 414 / MAFF 240422) TaxID=1213857 RepID=N4VJG9_COLOR|nr:hypothetical protein Cob_v012259 [Colletotrichum orbiculare MAFF 240422]
MHLLSYIALVTTLTQAVAMPAYNFASLPEVSPVDTPTQRRLDALAHKLHQVANSELKAQARERFASVTGQYGINAQFPKIQQDLDTSVDELAFSCLQKAINDDPLHPMVYSVLNPPRPFKQGGFMIPGGRYANDHPEQIYRTIPVNAKYDYVIRGKRTGGGPQDGGFTLINNHTAQSSVGAFPLRKLVVNTDGTFVLTLNATDSTAPNHVSIPSDAVSIMIRNTIADWKTQTPDYLEVEIVTPGVSAPSATEESIVNKARGYFSEAIPFYADFLLGNQTLTNPVNVIVQPTVSTAFGTVITQVSSFSHYNLSSTEALVITVQPWPSTYWILPSYRLFGISDDPWTRLSHLSSRAAVPNGDGTITAVLSTADPGVRNWIQATEDGVGAFMARFTGLPTTGEGASQVKLSSMVVPLDRLRDILPAGMKYVAKEERAAQYAEQAKGYSVTRNF